jgi:hypothetical protein
MKMRILKSLVAVSCALMAVAVFATATPAKAQNEPHYLQALSELRSARDYIQWDKGQFNGARRHAVDEINKAIEEIKHAAWDDGKNTMFAPPSAQGPGWMPLHQAQKWLLEANKHIQEGVDTPANTGLRDRAFAHTEEARHTLSALLESGAQ